MSSLFGIAANGASEFYPETIEQSLRFDGSTSKLEKTPSSDGDRKKWTSSWWVKRSKLGALQYMWSGASYSGNDGIAAIYFNSDDKIHMYFDASGSQPYGAINSRVYRDTTNWYHFVWAVDAANTVAKLWVNGVEETVGITPPNYDYGMNKASTKMAFGIASWGGSPNYNGYCAEFVHLDGQYLDETYFGEFKNGVWVPKNIEEQNFTFGTNGFYLPFSDSSNIGYDYQTSNRSGTTNDYTATGLASTDVVLDSPTNNFCTINSIKENALVNGSVTLSEGNLQSVDGGTTYGLHWSATFGMSTGKWYWEILAHTLGGNYGNIGITNSVQRGTTNGTSVFYCNNGNRTPHPSTSSGTTYGASYTNGDIIGVAFDADNETVTFYKNNSSQGAVGSVLTTANGEYFASVGDGQNSTTYKYVANFGQDSSFAGNKTAQGNADGNGQGDFYYTPPSGYLALCSSNLPDTTLSPNQAEQADDYFNTVLYTGNGGSSTLAVTGMNFQADWLWFKNRGASADHNVYDTNRGLSAGSIMPNLTNVEDSTQRITSIDADGFTLPATLYTYTNSNNTNYVVWGWKANGGTTSSNTDGTITSTVQVSTDAGFSIVTYTGNGTAGATIGHGLGVKPAMIIIKRTTGAVQDWMVYHHKNTSDPATDYLSINRDLATVDTNVIWNDTEPDTSVITLGGHDSINQNTQSHVAYVFAEIEGYSKFGSYTGNGNADGTFVYTGFRPAWVIVKRTTTNGYSWIMNDNKRDPINEVDLILTANSNSAENGGSTVDFDWLSNGFKCRNTNTNINTSAVPHIYMAFAEQPFKFSNAR